MEIITYNKQNKFQAEIMRLWNVFKIDWNKINKVRDSDIEVYNIGPGKREKIGVSLIVTSLVIPCTAAPITIPLIYKTMLGGRK